MALVVPLFVAGLVCKDSSGSELWKRESACQVLKNDTSVSSWFGEVSWGLVVKPTVYLMLKATDTNKNCLSKGETPVDDLCECDLQLKPSEGVTLWSQQGETLTVKGQGKIGRYMMGNP